MTKNLMGFKRGFKIDVRGANTQFFQLLMINRTQHSGKRNHTTICSHPFYQMSINEFLPGGGDGNSKGGNCYEEEEFR